MLDELKDDIGAPCHILSCSIRENSYKLSPETARILLDRGGFCFEQTWMDSPGWHAVTLARIRDDSLEIT